VTCILNRIGQSYEHNLTLNPLTWKIEWAPNNASRWQMGFNSAFKGLNQCSTVLRKQVIVMQQESSAL